MFTAEEIMTKDVISVTRETPIREAMELMLQHRISGLPVVDNQMNLLGIISEKDVVGLLYDTESLETQKVRNFMTERAIHFDIDDSLIDICDFFSKNLFRRVPITSDGKLVGIVSVPDIIDYTLKIKQEKEHTKSV
ncbi:MAG: CBS domain-containing protein [Sedimentisphaerales bacterium]|nr:CBS domain-containing protein [Sedimentisphaerales bacterium]